MSILKVDTINEKTTGNGIEIAHALKGSGMAGHVIQVVNGQTGNSDADFSTNTWLDIGLSAPITPSSTSSKCKFSR